MPHWIINVFRLVPQSLDSMPGLLKQISDSLFFTVRVPVSAFRLISVKDFNYEPQRAAVMADKKMGLLQFVLRVAVLLYIVIFVMMYKKG